MRSYIEIYDKGREVQCYPAISAQKRISTNFAGHCISQKVAKTQYFVVLRDSSVARHMHSKDKNFSFLLL